jgi:ribosomal protein S9
LRNSDSEDTYFATGCKLNFKTEADMGEIGIGIVGGGYMGKAHAVAMSAVGAVFDTGLRPRLEMVSAGSRRIRPNATAPLTASGAPRATGRSSLPTRR